MVKKLILLAPVLSVLLFFGLGTTCFADAAAQLEQAEQLEEQERFGDAEAIYKAVAEAGAGTADGLVAQEKLTILYVEQDKQAEAKAAYQQLLAKYSGLPGIAKALDHVGDAYREWHQYEEALAVYQNVVSTWPEAQHAVGSQSWIARMYILLGDDPNAAGAIERLMTDFSDNDGIGTAVHDVAYTYHHQARRYDKARQHYEWVVQNRPNDDKAIRAQMGIAKIHIVRGDDPNAAGAIERLMTDFSDNDGLGTAVHDVAYTYHHHARRYDKARQHYEWVVQNRPNDDKAIRAQMGIAKIHIVRGDDANAQAAIDKLIADYSEHEGIVKALDHIGDKYRKVDQYEKAREIYELVVTRWPDAKYAENSRMGLAKAIIEAHIADRDDEAVEGEIENLVAETSDNEALAKALFQLGEKYHRQAFRCQNKELEDQAKENFAKTAAVWDRIIHMPVSKKTQHAYYFSAGCYRHLGDYDQAIEYYEKVVNDWPDCLQASTSQYRIARCYAELEKAGQLATGDAIVLMRDACESVIWNYPDSPAAKAAGDLLQHVEFLESVDQKEGEN